MVEQVTIIRDADYNRLNRKARREMGLTIGNIREKLQELKQDGIIDNEAPTSEMALLVIERAEADGTFKTPAVGSIDWDKLFDFVERIVTLIVNLCGI